jgi:hypothetical protein
MHLFNNGIRSKRGIIRVYSREREIVGKTSRFFFKLVARGRRISTLKRNSSSRPETGKFIT